jgi:transposase
VIRKRRAFRRFIAGVPPQRLVFLDEAGANLSMGRSHAWVQRGTELVEPRPMNWGTNLTMIGAIRQRGWVTLGTIWGSANADRFVAWTRRRLAPRLKRGDVVVLDGAQAHKDPRVRHAIEAVGASLRLLPPYSPDFNPIEPCWALVKKHIKRVAPRIPKALRRAAHAGRGRVLPGHCKRFYQHAGYRQRRRK